MHGGLDGVKVLDGVFEEVCGGLARVVRRKREREKGLRGEGIGKEERERSIPSIVSNDTAMLAGYSWGFSHTRLGVRIWLIVGEIVKEDEHVILI